MLQNIYLQSCNTGSFNFLGSKCVQWPMVWWKAFFWICECVFVTFSSYRILYSWKKIVLYFSFNNRRFAPTGRNVFFHYIFKGIKMFYCVFHLSNIVLIDQRNNKTNVKQFELICLINIIWDTCLCLSKRYFTYIVWTKF